MRGVLRRLRAQDVAEHHEVAVLVRHLDADRGLARDRRDDAHVGRGQRVRDVARQLQDLVHLGAGGDLDLVHRDGGTAGAAGDARVDAERLERALERLHGVLLVAAVGRGRRRRPQEVERRQVVRAARGGDRPRLRVAGSWRARAPRPDSSAALPSLGRLRERRPRRPPATSRPSASRIESRPAWRGARPIVGVSVRRRPDGSRSGRDSRNSRTDSMMRETGVPVKISSPSVANPRQTMPEPIGESTRDSGWAASAPGQAGRGARARSAVRRRRGCPGRARRSRGRRTPAPGTR